MQRYQKEALSLKATMKATVKATAKATTRVQAGTKDRSPSDSAGAAVASAGKGGQGGAKRFDAGPGGETTAEASYAAAVAEHEAGKAERRAER